MTVVSASTLLGGVSPSAGQTFTVVIDPDTALEEIVDVSNYTSGTTLTITRGVENSGTGSAHSAGAVVRHMVTGRDLREANLHIEASAEYNDGTGTHTVHGVSGSVVGTTDTQTLTNKTIVAGSNTITGITSAMITDGTIVNADINASAAIAYSKLNLSGSIVSADIANDTIVDADINTAAAIAKTKISGTAVTLADTGTVTSTMIADGTIVNADINASAAIARTKIADPTADVSNGGFKLTSLGTPTDSTDASTKAYVDTSISNLIGGAPSTLDTLDEIAAALADTANFSDTVVLKTGSTMSGALAMGTNKITGLGTPTVSTDATTKGYVDGITTAPSNLTGVITSVGPATSIASQTGTGTKFVVDTSPTLVTPVLGVATATSINGTTIPSTKTLVVTTDKLSALAATSSSELAGVISDETGTGFLVFGTSPSITTATLTTPVVIAPEERTTVSATAATGTINFDASTQGVLYYTTNASANWTLNVRGASGVTLNSILATSDSITVAFMATQGSTAYYASSFTIDGSAVTPKWQGGTAPTSGNASSIDAYVYTIIKTASATFTVLASQTKFA
jgi:hypothetical protein